MTSYWGHYISSKHIDLYGSVWKYIGQTAKLQFNVEHDQMLGTPFSLSLVKSISYHPWWIDSHLVTLIGEGNFSSNTYMYIYIYTHLSLVETFWGVTHGNPTCIHINPIHQGSSIVINPRVWLVVSTLWKNMKVSWDCYSKYMGKNVPNHQPDIVLYHCHLLSFVIASLTSNFKVHHTCDLCKQQTHIYKNDLRPWTCRRLNPAAYEAWKHQRLPNKTSFDGLTPAARCAAHMQSRSCPSPAEPARARSKAMSWHASSMRHFFPTRTNRWH